MCYLEWNENGTGTQRSVVLVQNNRITKTERELFIDRYCKSNEYFYSGVSFLLTSYSY